MKLRLLFTFLIVALVSALAVSAVQALPKPQDVPTTVTVTGGANLHAGPGTTFARVGSVVAGDSLQVVGCNADCTWFKTASGAWIAVELLADPPPALPRVEATPALSAATATPGTRSLKLPTATPPVRDATVTPAAQASTAAVAVTTGEPLARATANLRAGPGTDFARVGSVQAGDALKLTGRTAAGDWLQLADGTWIAAFPVENAGTELPVVEDLPTPEPAAAAEFAAPPAEATAEQTPDPNMAQAPAEEPQAASAHDLVVKYINPHYNCEQGEYQFEVTPGIVEKIWAYRSFQIDMYITNNGVEPVDPPGIRLAGSSRMAPTR